METIQLSETRNTPRVVFNLENGTLKMEGKAFPEYPDPFYGPILNALKQVNSNSLAITMHFDYINTSSSKCVLNLLKTAQKQIENVSVLWVSEEDDEDIEETGKTFEDCCAGITFEFRTVKENEV